MAYPIGAGDVQQSNGHLLQAPQRCRLRAMMTTLPLCWSRGARKGFCNGEMTSCVGFVIVSLLCPCCAAARRGAGPRAAVPIPDSDDDDVVMEKEVALDTVLERRRQEAILNGEMIDLAADVGDEQLQRWVHSLAAFAVFCKSRRVKSDRCNA